MKTDTLSRAELLVEEMGFGEKYMDEAELDQMERMMKKIEFRYLIQNIVSMILYGVLIIGFGVIIIKVL